MLKTGLVVEINKNNIIILTAKNEYLILQRKLGVQPSLGEEYTGYLYKKESLSYKLALSITLMILICTLTYFIYNKNTVKYSIMLDMNASIELKINGYGKIINYSALNDSGEKILDTTPVKNKTYSEAVFTLYESAKKSDYLKNFYSNKKMVISVYITNHNKLTVDLSKFKNQVLSDNIQIYINDNGTEK